MLQYLLNLFQMVYY